MTDHIKPIAMQIVIIKLYKRMSAPKLIEKENREKTGKNEIQIWTTTKKVRKSDRKLIKR